MRNEIVTWQPGNTAKQNNRCPANPASEHYTLSPQFEKMIHIISRMPGEKGALTAILTPEIPLFYPSPMGYDFICLYWAAKGVFGLYHRIPLMKIIGRKRVRVVTISSVERNPAV